VLLADVAAASVDVAATRSRTAKAERLAQVLRDAAPEEVAVVASWLSGELRQRRTGVGWRSLQGLPGPAPDASLEVLEVDAAFAHLAGLSGTGSAATRTAALQALWARATADEQRLLGGLVSGDLRQGASAGLVADAVARAADVPVASVRRALTLHGSLPDVATAAMAGGQPALDAFSLQVGRGLAPMLAGAATDLDDAWERLGGGRRSTGSSTACASRCTATATTCTCSPARWTTSPHGCPRWSRPCARCRRSGWCSTARRWRSAPTAAPGRSRRRRRARPAARARR
jgi:DNA ligase-1